MTKHRAQQLDFDEAIYAEMAHEFKADNTHSKQGPLRTTR